MASMQFIEQFAHTPQVALALLDRLAQALHMGGAFPPALGDISCEVIEATAPVQRSYAPARVLGVQRTRAGYLTLDGSYSDASQPGRSWVLAPGTYRVRVSGALYRTAEFMLTWPPAADDRRVRIPKPPADIANVDNVELYPSAAYPMPDLTLGRNQLGPTLIRGCALGADGSSIAGIVVEVVNLQLLQPAGQPVLGSWPFLQTTTAANGDWALVLPGRL